MKISKKGSLMFGIGALIAVSVTFLLGYYTGVDGTPNNCAELGAAYLEIGKKELGITDFGSDAWNKLVQDETDFTNRCYESLMKNLE